MEFTLDTVAIAEIGYALSKSLRERGVLRSKLTIALDERSFKKVDEDLFYRNKEEGSKDEFISSDDEINVEIEGLTIVFEKRRDGIQ